MELSGELLRAAADETDDAHDHDELHAAAVIMESDPIWATSEPYVKRWLEGLVRAHKIDAEV